MGTRSCVSSFLTRRHLLNKARIQRNRLRECRTAYSRYGTKLRFCQPWKKWLCGRRSSGLQMKQVNVRLAKATARRIYREAAEIEDDGPRKAAAKWAHESEKAERIAAMIKLAQSELGVPALPAELDSDRWLLNCLNGIIDLRTGKLLPHRREDLITSSRPWSTTLRLIARGWLRFLEEILNSIWISFRLSNAPWVTH